MYMSIPFFYLCIGSNKNGHIKVIIDSMIILHHNIEFPSYFFFMSTNFYHLHKYKNILTHTVMQYYFQQYAAVEKVNKFYEI